MAWLSKTHQNPFQAPGFLYFPGAGEGGGGGGGGA